MRQCNVDEMKKNGTIVLLTADTRDCLRKSERQPQQTSSGKKYESGIHKRIDGGKASQV